MSLPGPAVHADWLQRHLGDVVVADVRWSIDRGPQKQDYLNGHIPGAVFVDLDDDLSTPPGPNGRHPLPSAEAFAETRRRLGFDPGVPVVAYDDRNGAVASRLWWMLDAIGHPAAVLNGGLAAWNGALEEGFEVPNAAPDVVECPWPAQRLISADEIEVAISSGAVALDARSAERFRGEPNSIDPRFGHIPGATSRPWTTNLDASGKFADPEVLRSTLAMQGVSTKHELIASCGSGVTACHNLLACRIAGLGEGRLYVGSWSEWGADESRPVETDF